MRKFSLYRKCCAWNSLPLKPADAKAHPKFWHIRIQKNMVTESFIFLMVTLLPKLHWRLKMTCPTEFIHNQYGWWQNDYKPARLQRQCLLHKLMILAYKNSKKGSMSSRTVPKESNFKPLALMYPANLLQLQGSREPCERIQALTDVLLQLCVGQQLLLWPRPLKWSP